MKEIRCIVTNDNKKKYWKEYRITPQPATDCMHVINVYPDIEMQTVHGFGGAFTEASAYNYSLLKEDKREEMLEGYFGESGLRYHMGRLHIHSCDFALGNYTYVEEGDEDLSTFSVNHDRKYMLPMLQDALKKAGKITFLASPWSPPAYMKTNGEMNHGGKLKEQYRSLWARYMAKFVQEYRKEGIDIRYLTVQNEPMAVQTWDSCVYEMQEEKDFVKHVLGPVLKGEKLDDVKIFVWDHNKEELYDRVKPMYEDKGAADYIAGAAVHWYTGDHFEGIELIRRAYPDKEVFFTEGCVEFSRFADSGEVQKAEMYAHDMLGNLKSGVSAVLDWNLLLDEKGGPNHVGNYCAAPMMCNPAQNTLEKRLSYYYIGHFSRYIKPGAKQIGHTKYTDKIETAAFINPDGERAVVVLNKGEQAAEITLREKGVGTMYTIEGHSIVTFVYRE